MLKFRNLATIDRNCRHGVSYAVTNIDGVTHTIFVAPMDETDWSDEWQVQIHVGDVEDELLDEAESLMGSVIAPTYAEAKRLASVIVASDLALLPFFDAIDTHLDRLDHAYGDTAISALFTADTIATLPVRLSALAV